MTGAIVAALIAGRRVASRPSENLSRQAVQVGYVVNLRAVVAIVAGLAGYVPARRASRIDPSSLLRTE